MNRETKKIALACFIGGALFTVAAFCLAPMFWWLGMLAGIVGGYFGYEFREVLRAIPKAWRAARRRAGNCLPKMVKAIAVYLRRPHPFGYLSFVIVVTMLYLLIRSEIFIPAEAFGPGPIVVSMVLFLGLWGFFVQTLDLIALFATGFDLVAPDKLAKMDEAKRGDKTPLTYGNAFYCLAKGFWSIAFFFIWEIWKYLYIGLGRAFYFIRCFLKDLFIFIHSNERVLCAIDGTLGGMAAFLWLTPSAETFAAKAAVAIFGGLLGAGFGVINYELVSKRWLKLVLQP